MPKFILFTKNTDAGCLFKHLSNKYRNEINFGVITNKNKELIKLYDVKKFPKLMLVNNDY